jgi:anti-sigma B factor antagonist
MRSCVRNLEGGITVVDCAGLGELVSLFKLTGEIGAELRLTNLSQRVKQLLDLTQLLSVFGDTSDEQSAVASLPKVTDIEMREVTV